MTGVLRPLVSRRQLTVAILVAVLIIGALTTVPLLGLAEDDEPGQPIVLFGSAEDEADAPAPEGTTIFAVVDGEVQDDITIEEAGEYGGPETFDDGLTVDSNAGEEVTFHINSPDGPQANEVYEIPDSPPSDRVEFNLTFPAGSFEPAELTLELDADELSIGETTQATATATFGDDSQSDVTEEADFSVADPDVVTVDDDGTVTAEGEGETTITATFADAEDTVTVEVVDDTTLSLSVDTTTLEPEEETTATVEFTEDGETTDVTDDAEIESSDSDVVSVAGATLTAEDVGETTITATFEGFEDSVTVTVDEDDDEPADDDPAPAPSPPGDDGPPPTTGDPGPPEDADVAEERIAALEVDDEVSTAAFEEGAVRSVRFDTPVSGSVTTRDLEAAPEDNLPGEFVSASQIVVPSAAESLAATVTKSVEQPPGDADSLHVFRLVDGDWERLETDVVEETDEAVTIETQTPGFSVFAVSSVESPTAAFDVTPAEPTAGDELTLDAGASTPTDDIVTYEWTVNGQTLTGETVTITPDEAGDLTVELTVETTADETATVSQTIEVGAVDEDDEPEDDEPVDDEPEDDEPEDDAVPGFGVAVAALALLSAALLARMRS